MLTSGRHRRQLGSFRHHQVRDDEELGRKVAVRQNLRARVPVGQDQFDPIVVEYHVVVAEAEAVAPGRDLYPRGRFRVSLHAIVLICVHINTIEVQHVSVNHHDYTPGIGA